ncbi:MAG: plasmid pRiA4b ORF-3 family protein [Bacteroidia bacterium]|jgi:hypothetical protein|nr:plasmid pRiA4b ORF-3 family protein [Bacteroidales bacterium]NCD41725.1 plasmid pRiA4b ORF-3 family protein [Bacteroidia bacterium]
MNVEIYQVDISILNIEPAIWRQIEVPSDISLSDFHKLIQIVMGWKNKYKHRFVKDMTFYSPTAGLMDDEYTCREYVNMKLSDLLEVVKDKMIYNYDFKDNWAHEILLEQKKQPEKGVFYPRVNDGEGNCPPERCGGVEGFYEILDVLDNPDHMDYEDTIDFLGGDYDPDYFNVEEINAALKTAFNAVLQKTNKE